MFLVQIFVNLFKIESFMIITISVKSLEWS